MALDSDEKRAICDLLEINIQGLQATIEAINNDDLTDDNFKGLVLILKANIKIIEDTLGFTGYLQ